MTERDPGTNPDNQDEPTSSDDVQASSSDAAPADSLAERLSGASSDADPTTDALSSADGTTSPDDGLPEETVAAAVTPPKKKKKTPPATPAVPVAPAAPEDSLLWPGEEDDIPPTGPIPPSKRALIALGVLAVVMFGLAGLVFAQSAATAQEQYSTAQVNVMVELLKEPKITFTEGEVTKMADAWQEGPIVVDPTADQLRDLINAQVPGKQVTTEVIQKQIDDNRVGDNKQSPLRMPTADEIESSFRTQGLIFAGLGLVVAVAGYFYFRGNKWGRLVAMFASGLVTVMYLMQLVSGALSLPVIAVTLAGAAAFWFTLQGRLVPLAPRPGGGAGFGGLGSLFKPKPRN